MQTLNAHMYVFPSFCQKEIFEKRSEETKVRAVQLSGEQAWGGGAKCERMCGGKSLGRGVEERGRMTADGLG